MGTKHDEA